MPLSRSKTPASNCSALFESSCATWFYVQAFAAHTRLRVSTRQEGRLYPGEGQEIVQDISARLAGEAPPNVDALQRTGSQSRKNSRRKIGPEVELELATTLGKAI